MIAAPGQQQITVCHPASPSPLRLRSASASYRHLPIAGLLLLTLAMPLAGCRRSSEPAAAAEKTEKEAVTVEVIAAAVRPMETTVSATGTLAPGEGATARI